MGCASSVQSASDPSFHHRGKNNASPLRDRSTDDHPNGPVSVYGTVVPAPILWLQSVGPDVVSVSWTSSAESNGSDTTRTDFVLEMEKGAGKGYIEVYR